MSNYAYSNGSRASLATCHPDLQLLFNRVIKYRDCTILCGHRGVADQQEAVRSGNSDVVWPHSMHNKTPSLAVDVAPYFADRRPHIDWERKEDFLVFSGIVIGIAGELGISIRWGGDWDGDWNQRDQNLVDLPHFELVPPITLRAQ